MTLRSDAIFASPLARKRTSGKQYCLAASGDYAPSLRSLWHAARDLFRFFLDEDFWVFLSAVSAPGEAVSGALKRKGHDRKAVPLVSGGVDPSPGGYFIEGSAASS
ncbi:MAG: hypothetical protein GY703_06010 [Gammaproteobacteria bacterium]|nr:hypothetical protein [Gammaproteobacteria bacterium]